MSHATASAIQLNPCTCTHCQPYKVRHWFCDHCGEGPFTFVVTERAPGTFRRPLMTRQKSTYDGEAHQWQHWVRYACSRECLKKEGGVVLNELIELAGKRPDLSSAITAEVTVRTAEGARQDDLAPAPQPSEGGAYDPGVDDL